MVTIQSMKERSTTASASRIITSGSRATVLASTSYRTFNDSIALGKMADLGDDLMLLGELMLAPVQFTPPVVGQWDPIVSIHGNASGISGRRGGSAGVIHTITALNILVRSLTAPHPDL
jgi:hypothetical protein